jgi:uncharacterized protein (TIGR03905 family)
METIERRIKGTCSDSITIVTDGEIIVDVKFEGGCPGSLEAVRRLVIGMKAEDVAERLLGIRCGCKATSCPDQLAKALRSGGGGR